MQTAPRFWMRDTRGRVPRPVRLPLGAGRLGGTIQQGQWLDIPRGSGPCPNPLCREPHGPSAGALCAGCLLNREGPSAMLDSQSYDGHTEAANPRVSQRTGYEVCPPLSPLAVVGEHACVPPCSARPRGGGGGIATLARRSGSRRGEGNMRSV